MRASASTGPMSAASGTAERAAVPYALTARVYDRIYAGKDYAGEARRLRELIRKNGPPRARSLLDVACGTGAHLAYLSGTFQCVGVDPSEGMLRIARRKLPRIHFVPGRMETLDLGMKFDALTCLFSAIAYVRTERDLRRTLRNFAAHLRPGGVAIVEPWLTPSVYRTGRIHVGSYGDESFPIARMNVAARQGNRSILEMHHLVGTPAGVRHWVEVHNLGMFEVRAYRAAFLAAGFRAKYLRNGFSKERGLYVAVLSKRERNPASRPRPTRGRRSSPRRRGN